MSLDFIAPAWLLLLAPLALVWWRRRTPDRAHHGLRALFPALVVLALAQPRLNLERRGGVLVVVADRSASLPPDAASREDEIIRLLEQERGSHDRLAIVGFAETVGLEQMPSPGRFPGFTGFYAGTASRLSAALDTARGLIPRDRHGRILVLGDGRFTDSDPLDLGLERGARIPVDHRLLERASGLDMAVMGLDLPTTVEPGEAFQFSAELLIPEATEITYRLLRDGRELANATVRFAAGRRHLLFQDRLAAAGNARYRLEITSPLTDPYPENNRADAIVAVLGGKPLLHAGPAGSRLPQLAAAGGLDIVHLDPAAMQWNLDGLSRFRGVILENTPASSLGHAGQEALARFIEDLGGGLMITGGRQSFGVGGYFNSPLSELLPVSMELRREHRKLSTAVVVVLDRSGSMSIGVPGGLTKMDLANQGTAAALELLTDNDEIGVLAVDSQAHIIVNLAKIGDGRDAMARRIRAIKSMGGGIFVYEGLHQAAKMIAGASAGTRHIILFADAADAEEPGDYKKLVAQLRELGVTLSVIGLGTEKDCDADLLKDIAARGGGNIYFSDSAKELPQLFAQETLTVFRGAFVEEPTPLVWAEDLPTLTEVPAADPPPLGGYNLCYLRPGARLGARADDEYQSPLLAFWQRGAGRTLAFTGEVDGKFTGEFGAWPGTGPLYLSCLRWLASREGENDDWFVSAQRDGNDVLVSLELDPARERDPFRARPRLLHLRETPAGILREELPFSWAGRDRLTCRATLAGDGASHFHLLAEKPDGKAVVQHCASQCLPYPLEFVPETDPGRGPRTLARLAALTGGSERHTFDGIFRDIPPFRRPIPLWHALALAAILALLLEVAYRRLGFAVWRQARAATPAFAKFAPRNPVAPTDQPGTPTTPPPSGSILGAIRKARHSSDQRLRDEPPPPHEES
jgi:Mg-chelatase subunit ChlD